MNIQKLKAVLLQTLVVSVFSLTIVYSGYIVYTAMSTKQKVANATQRINISLNQLKSAVENINVCNENLVGKKLGQKVNLMRSETGLAFLETGKILGSNLFRINNIILENLPTSAGGVKLTGGIGVITLRVTYEIFGSPKETTLVRREAWVPVKADSTGKIVSCHLPAANIVLGNVHRKTIVGL